MFTLLPAKMGWRRAPEGSEMLIFYAEVRELNSNQHKCRKALDGKYQLIKYNPAVKIWLKQNKSTTDLSALNECILRFIERKHPTERATFWDKKHLGLSVVLLNTWKLILLFSVAAWLPAKPSLQEELASLDDLKDNRACWFLYNVHTRTGNRLLSSTQPPQLLSCSNSHTHSVRTFIF